VLRVRKTCTSGLAVALSLGTLLAAQQGRSQSQPSHQDRTVSFDVREYGARGDGETLDTEPVQRALRACADAGGGTVLFPPGKYVSGTLEVFSNTTLELAPGAILQGSADIHDYRPGSDFGLGRNYGVDSSGEGTLAGLLVAHNVENVSIIGRGTIDGRGDEFMDFSAPHVSADFDPQYTRQGAAFRSASASLEYGPIEPKAHGAGRPGTLILFFHANNVLVRDVTIQNAPNWTLHLQSVQRATIHGIHILNNLLIPNNDGIDCMECRNVHISDCDIQAGDDDFAIVGSEDIQVSNCSLLSRSAAIRLESTQRATFQGLTMQTNRGIGIFHRGEGRTDSVLFSNIAMRTTLIPGHWWGKAEPIYIAVSPCRDKPCEGVSNIRFSNIDIEAEGGAVLAGDQASPITGLVFDNVRIRMRAPDPATAAAVGGNFDLRWTATSMKDAVFKHDIPALYCRWVQSLTLRNFAVSWLAGLPDYFSGSIEGEDFHDVRVDGIREVRAVRSGNPVITMRRGSGLSVSNAVATPAVKTLLHLESVTDVHAPGDIRHSHTDKK
jgi:hypothetical protein